MRGRIAEDSDDEDGDYFDDDPLFAVLMGAQQHMGQRPKARAKPHQATEAEWQARYQSQSCVPLKKKKARKLTFMSDVPQRPLLPRPPPGLAPAGASATAGGCCCCVRSPVATHIRQYDSLRQTWGLST